MARVRDVLKALMIFKQREARRAILNARVQLFSFERRFFDKVIDDNATLIKEKVPGIDLSDVKKSAYLIFKRNIEKALANRNRQNFSYSKGRKDVIIVRGFGLNNFKNLQKLITDTKRYILEESLAEISESKNAVKRATELQDSKAFQRTRAANLAIIGADINPKSLGGDINLKTNIKDGRFVGLGEITKKYVLGSEQRGFQIGHTFGPGLHNMERFVGEENSLITFFKDDKIKARLLEIRETVIDTEVISEIDADLFRSSGFSKGTLTVTIIQSSKENQLGVADFGSLSKEFIGLVEQQLEKFYKAKSSKSIEERYTDYIESLFLTGKVNLKDSKIKKKTSIKGKSTVGIPVYAPEIIPNKRAFKKNPKRAVKQTVTSLQYIVDLINERFHDYIQDQMGTGESKQKLNYRTGRFAESAKLKALYPAKNTATAVVQYMKYPYGVFEKGGRLYKPLRDPKGIFGRSIRQILIDEKIASLSRVNVETYG